MFHIDSKKIVLGGTSAGGHLALMTGMLPANVPYSHSVRLHEALEKAAVLNELMTIPGGKHGRFTKEENLQIEATMKAFLSKSNIFGR
ncbi:MAG: prolyl oligopeptidase family serine peptidase [bacterium]